MWQDFWDAFIYFPDDPFKYTAVWSSSVIWSVQCFDALDLSLSLHLLLARNQTWHDVSVKDNLVYKQQDKFDFYFHSMCSITIWTPQSSCLFFAHSNANNTDLANSWQLWWVEGRCFENTNAKAGLINLDHFLSSKSFHFDLLVSIQRWPAYHHHDCHSESVRLRCEFKTVWWRQSTRWRSGGREWKCLQLWSFSPKLRPEAKVRSFDSFEIFWCHLMCFFKTPANSNFWKYNWNTTQNSEATRKCWPKWFT